MEIIRQRLQKDEEALGVARAEMNRLAERIRFLETQIAAGRAVLERDDFEKKQAAVGIGRQAPSPPKEADTPVRPDLSGVGFREAIRTALKEAPSRPADVVAFLKRNGFKGIDDEKISIRVNNELWRMRKLGVVERESGMYRVKST